MPEISIILPVHNGAAYIANAIHSIQKQSLSEWELIIVNDGSTDNTLEICNYFCKNDKNIRVISKNRGGVSAARNLGIDSAIGQYLLFVDADDELPENGLYELWNAANEFSSPDIIKANHSVKLHDGTIIETKYAKERIKYAKKEICNSEFINQIALHHPVVWSALYKKSFINQHNIRFNEFCKNREDLLFWLDINKFIFRCVYIDKICYQYTLGVSQSLSNSISFEMIDNDIYLTGILQDYINGIDVSNQQINRYIDSILDVTLRNLLRVNFSKGWNFTKKLSSSKSKNKYGISTLAKIYNCNALMYFLLSRMAFLLIPSSKRIRY